MYYNFVNKGVIKFPWLPIREHHEVSLVFFSITQPIKIKILSVIYLYYRLYM